MKIIHASLQALLTEVKERNVGAVRLAAVMQNDTAANGTPRRTSWIVVSAPVGWDQWDQWVQWQHSVGGDGPELGEDGGRIPYRIMALMKERLIEVCARVVAAGLEVRDGIIADDAEAVPSSSWASALTRNASLFDAPARPGRSHRWTRARRWSSEAPHGPSSA
jgi:hypothetical protein